MLPSNNIQSIVGATLYGRDKAKLGKIDQVLVDATAGHPTWAVLHGGMFGRKNLFVPLDDATWEHDDVYVELEKDDVKNAPHPDSEGGLSPAEEQELRAYYSGHDADESSPPGVDARLATSAERTDADADHNDDGDDRNDDQGEDIDGPKHATEVGAPVVDESVVLVQERLVVRTEQVPVARVNLDAIDDVDATDARRSDASEAADAPDARPRTDDTNPDDNRPGPDRVII
ncbi:PRC-barrel domain-containing protein [Herbiconiux sp. CPCC 205763]|uniref:PRC-barrel domain-containing protein n=1 Tax=Herbiconiux aconitum TaxID=2970913 RepID=A0ABT2GP92_9MICO|nr:PRC-barrel domain-containing protein [Herbiconiux aconitum]MCS5718045.1 PRC-barrel domain-containing protein [Herbiconiux aconitum]